MSGALPETLPIFPLPGALLLPRGRLPLNIFEARYLALVEDSLGEGRVFGMVQTRHPEPHPVPDGAPVFDVGCAGRMVAFAETGDGRYMITLLGVARFRIATEIVGRNGYRCVRADFTPFTAADLGDEAARVPDRAHLLKAVRAYYTAVGQALDWPAVEAAPDEALVTSLAMACPFDWREKQALLECDGLAARADLLVAMLEMAARGGGGDAAASVRH